MALSVRLLALDSAGRFRLSGWMTDVQPKRIRRSPADLRAEALAAARRLVRDGGDLTLKAVADEVGVTYPNISHHFGSSAGLHAAVAEEMVADLLASLREITGQIEATKPRLLVDRVFDRFDAGLGRVIAWLAQAGESARLDPVRAMLADYVTDAGRRETAESTRITHVAVVISLTAFGEAQAGNLVGGLLGVSAEDRRDLLAELIAPIV